MLGWLLRRIDKKKLRNSMAYGLWGGTFGGLTMLAVNAARYSELPGFLTRSIIIGVAATMIFGSLGYLFWSGILLKDD